MAIQADTITAWRNGVADSISPLRRVAPTKRRATGDLPPNKCLKSSRARQPLRQLRPRHHPNGCSIANIAKPAAMSEDTHHTRSSKRKGRCASKASATSSEAPASGSLRPDAALTAYAASLALHHDTGPVNHPSSTISQTRSSSPSKKGRPVMMSLAERPVKSVPDRDAPAAAKGLQRRMRQIARGQEVLPSSARLSALDIDESELGEDAFYSDVVEGAEPHMSPTDFSIAALRIVRASDNALAERRSEAAWNCEVLARVLDLALVDGPSDTPHVDWLNITTAPIDPPSLAPCDFDANIQTRKVDFGIVFSLEQPIVRELARRYKLPVNQTNYGALNTKPLAVSIESKLPGEDLETAKEQLRAWAFAQFARLRQLFEAVPPFLPLVIVQGGEWRILYAWQREDAGILETFVTHGAEFVGSTHSVSGVSKVVALVTELRTWTLDTYRSWFLEQVVRVTT
ncbi:hypothetical protein FH972_024093 [Carpinus fangiana]|uniref:PD-(D/E)XK nuclease-like domain-containing protein n=1 Tax=Carpinus fangiana TaxID=176857 RepID=A0A5N6KX22_9ROSI|nr:hypothetical protein FH972_024093 [Carpinus fangiana]